MARQHNYAGRIAASFADFAKDPASDTNSAYMKGYRQALADLNADGGISTAELGEWTAELDSTEKSLKERAAEIAKGEKIDAAHRESQAERDARLKARNAGTEDTFEASSTSSGMSTRSGRAASGDPTKDQPAKH